MHESLGSVLTHWHGHIEVIVGLGGLMALYLLGVGPLREKYNWAEEIDPKRIATFTLGVMVIFLSLVSPIHILSDSYLFSVHMVQHMLLALVAPPLIIWGTPDWLIRPLLRPDWIFIIARTVRHPVIALAAFNLAFALWHIPAIYNLSVTNHWWHVSEHLMFIGAAMIMWWPLMSNMPELPRLSYPLQIVYMFALSISQIIVFAFVTFSDHPLYTWYVHAPQILGISPLADQQIGGVIMKVGSAGLFTALLVIAFMRWYQQENSSAEPDHTELTSYKY
ncbi:MAG: cytochrome c oxidase assembly protein [SAR202 cluster bacterium]|nr:cytochrome c oxidase assembly protein [SAR202 cluster bacterium]